MQISHCIETAESRNVQKLLVLRLEKCESHIMPSVLRSLRLTLRLAQIHQPRRTVELRNRLSNLVLLRAGAETSTLHRPCWCCRQDRDTLDLIRLLMGAPPHDHRVACVPLVEDLEGDGWLIALAVEEFLLVCEGVGAELGVGS